MGFWDESRWTRPFGYRPGPREDNPYTLGYHIGQDIAGSDWYGPVPALRSGVVVGSGRSGKIGGYVVVRVGGQFDTYCHLNSRALPGAGKAILAGGGVAPLARSTNPSAGQDYTGSASTGPHLHFVVSTQPDTAYNPAPGEPIDPRPIIRSITNGSAAGGGATPFNPEDDMPYSEEQLSKIITNAVWGQGGEPAYRPMILNRSSGQSEYPELTLGGMQRRIEAESAPRFLKPVLDAIAGIVEAVYKRPVTRQGGSLKGQTNLEATLAYADANFQAGRDSVKQSVLDAIKTLPTGPDGSVNADAVAEKVVKPAIDQLRKDLTGPAQIDYDKLAAALAKQGIAASVADELAQRLKS